MDLFFSTLKSGFKNIRIRYRIRKMRVDGSRVRKVKVADSKISGYVWTGHKCMTTINEISLFYQFVNQPEEKQVGFEF